MLTAFDVKERHRAIANAVASQRLDGLEPDAHTIADLERVADGSLSITDVVRALHERIATGEFRSLAAR